LQLAVRLGDPRQLLHESPRRGEPGARPGLDLRVESDHSVPHAREPPEERRALMRKAWLGVVAVLALGAAGCGPPTKHEPPKKAERIATTAPLEAAPR